MPFHRRVQVQSIQEYDEDTDDQEDLMRQKSKEAQRSWKSPSVYPYCVYPFPKKKCICSKKGLVEWVE